MKKRLCHADHQHFPQDHNVYFGGDKHLVEYRQRSRAYAVWLFAFSDDSILGLMTSKVSFFFH